VGGQMSKLIEKWEREENPYNCFEKAVKKDKFSTAFNILSFDKQVDLFYLVWGFLEQEATLHEEDK
jgi:hypothetical protein